MSFLKSMRSILRIAIAGACGQILFGQVSVPTETVTDAYVYLLGRAIVIRQEQTDLKEPGITYNVIKYNPVGSADFVNPNLDVAYLEAWIAVDERTPVQLEIPEIRGRYYTAQILDEWGEVITNINERNYPLHPHGKFVFVAPGSRVAVPADAVRIELHSKKAKMLARVELKTDPEGAKVLQRKFQLTALGKPDIRPPVAMPSFDNAKLLGAEIFDNVDDVIASAQDISPVAAEMQAKARDLGQQAKDPEKRTALDKLIREKIVPQFLSYAVTKSGVFQNNWLATLGTGNYGANYWTRTSANLVGLWANTNDEVIYFVVTRDGDGQPLNGSHAYHLSFPAVGRPDAVVNGYWSVILVDVPDYRVVPNPLKRYNLNSYSPLQSAADGSLKIEMASKRDPGTPESNWLPAPDGKAFSLTFRTYVPKELVKRGEWFPPSIQRIR